jgi:hypothetical protein
MLCFLKYFRRNSIITLVFKKNACFCRKWGKIAEICGHSIGPWYVGFSGCMYFKIFQEQASQPPVPEQPTAFLRGS